MLRLSSVLMPGSGGGEFRPERLFEVLNMARHVGECRQCQVNHFTFVSMAAGPVIIDCFVRPLSRAIKQTLESTAIMRRGLPKVGSKHDPKEPRQSHQRWPEGAVLFFARQEVIKPRGAAVQNERLKV
jgi:hypothetical protein